MEVSDRVELTTHVPKREEAEGEDDLLHTRCQSVPESTATRLQRVKDLFAIWRPVVGSRKKGM